MGLRHSKCADQFKRLDKGNRGWVTVDEILTAHESGELRINIPMSALILFHFNRSGDGHIMPEEFAELCKFARVHRHMKEKDRLSSKGSAKGSSKGSRHRRATSYYGQTISNYGLDGNFTEISRKNFNFKESGTLTQPTSDNDSSNTGESGRNTPWLLDHIEEEDTKEILSDLLSHKEKKEKFIEWLFKSADVDKHQNVSTSGLESILTTLAQDGIDPLTLTYSNGDERDLSSIVSDVLNEYDTHNSGRLSKEDFHTLADVILKEYETIFKRVTVTSHQVGKYIFTRTLGTGSDGVVKIAVDKETGHRNAIKIIHKGCVADMSRLDVEIASMKMLDHKHVVKLEEVFEEGENIFLVLELCAGGSIKNYLHKFKSDEAQTRCYFEQLLDGVEYCHSRGVAHRDLRMDNILLDQLGNLKISDFGHAGIFKQGWDYFSTMLVGSIYHTAPEQVNGQCYSGEAIDVWSLGIILYEMVAGEPPFTERDAQRLINKIRNCEYTFPDDFSDDLRDLLGHLLLKDPQERLTIPMIREHPWMFGERKSLIRWTHSIKISGDLLRKYGDQIGSMMRQALQREGDDLKFHPVVGEENKFHVIDVEKNLKFSLSIIGHTDKMEILFELLEGESWTFLKICRKLKRDMEDIFNREEGGTEIDTDSANSGDSLMVPEDFACGSLNTPAPDFLEGLYGGNSRPGGNLEVNLPVPYDEDHVSDSGFSGSSDSDSDSDS